MVIAVDVGFGRVKAVCGHQAVEFPSVIADFTPVAYSSGMQERGSAEQAIEYKGERFFTGELARRQGTPRATLDSRRITAREGLVLLFAALTALLPPGVQPVKLVVGLPVSDYDFLKEKYRQAMLGPHQVKTLDLQGKVEREYLFKIEEAKVLPQPFGTLFSRLLDEKGEKVQTTISENDGYYYFEDVRSGSYLVQVYPYQVKREVEMPAEGGYLDNINFYPEDISLVEN